MPSTILRRAAPLLAAGLVACAEVADPLPPPEALLLVPDSATAELAVRPILAPEDVAVLPLGPGATPTGVATRGGLAALPLGSGDQVVVIDLALGTVLREVDFPVGAYPSAAAFASDTVLFVALAGIDRVGRVSLVTGDTSSMAVGVDPRGLAFTRGRLFVLNANTEPCAGTADRCARGPSWITAIDPAEFAGAGTPDSIGLPGAVNATTATVGIDGQLYVVAAGDPASPEGRLHVVDPVEGTELANFGGLGSRPGSAAALDDRILIASRSEGLLEFDTRAREFLRGAGEGVPLAGAVGVAVDEDGRVWVPREADCPGTPGVLSVLRRDLTLLRELPSGPCPSGVALALVPREP
ncbi:MAG TPA: hypothetical protein VLA95_07670 [Gemmatimonadales bacterium]|nr:hypothetical protein [Gemmatimonadales bacterium]